jgi:hypothetical protein
MGEDKGEGEGKKEESAKFLTCLITLINFTWSRTGHVAPKELKNRQNALGWR